MSDNNNNFNWGSVAGGMLGMIGGHLGERRNYRNNRRMMELQYQNQRNLNQQGHDLQMDMWNKTNASAQVQHYKDAGLNPALMYGTSGATGTTGSQGGGSASMGSSQQGKVMDLQNALVGAQIGKLVAETDNIKEGTKKTGSEINNLIKTGGLIDAQALKTMNEAELKGFERDIMEIDKNWLIKNKLSTMSVKELKLINDATGGNLQGLLEVFGDRAREVKEFVEDPVGKTEKILKTAGEKIQYVFDELKKKIDFKNQM